jgi:3'-5' exonuclease
MMNIFVFDIETVPDTITGAKIHQLGNMNDTDIADAMFKIREQETQGSSFLPHYCQKIVAISAVLRMNDKLKVCSLAEREADEKELIQRFYSIIEKYTPTLISWNGSGFDLPVLHYRSLLHGVPAPRYWEVGDGDSQFRWNNYLNRYHYRHLDLMDVLSAYQGRACASLQAIALMLDLPGKMGISGSDVWEYYQKNEIDTIRNYCETDVLNTYLIYLRFELIRGKISAVHYHDECVKLRHYLNKQEKSHFSEFVSLWKSCPNEI